MNLLPKILAVDDKPENLLALRVILKGLEIELIEAASGNDALKATLHHNFALALLDIQMPGMDGFELAGILREEEKTANLPFIFISAVYTDNQNIFKGYEKGAFSFITKPFQPEILINKIKFFIDKHQQELSLIGLYRDLQNKNRELEFLNHELESFSYSVSHDLRAPLRRINAYATILKENNQDKLDDEANKIISVIRDNALKMDNLIESLLKLSQLGRKEIRKVEIDMNKLVARVMDEFKSENSNPHFNLHKQVLPAANGDVELLTQVFLNLVSNAVKYSGKKEKPDIEIGFTASDNQVIYYVKDNGAGFDMTYKNKLFGVFQRLHSTTDFEGIGIGLAIVQRIITRHGGRVWAEGEVNKGATFYFSLSS
ncbi:MAG: ATP-binding protein [Ferruginibacter sp.]